MDTSQPQTLEDTEFVKFWNEVLAPKFIRYKHILVDGLSRHSAKTMPLLPVRRGDSVLDVGCGFGDTAIQLARLVGPEGRVTAMDCCDAFMDFGRADAEAEGLTNVTFARGDAEVALPKAEFDFVFSRFGTMFFTNPVVAMRRMREALKPGGRMAHIVWRTRLDNPAWEMPRTITLQHLPKPGDDAATCGPGPFSMADEDTTRAQMKAAGYDDIAFERVDEKILIGSTPRDAIDFALAIGPAGEVFREAGDLAEQRRDQIEDDMRAFFGSQEKTGEGIWAESSSWVITARNPG